jgi:glutaredoxin 2
VKLYMFEHCALCFRVRMAAALKRLHLQERVVLDDDTPTMVDLVGKRVIPILVKDSGELAALIESPTAVNGALSLDDIRVLPLLRAAAVVKGLRFPQKVRAYFEAMMDRVGYAALPAT